MVDLALSKAREELAVLVERTESERIVLTKDGKPVAAIVCIEDLEVLEHLDRLEDEMDRIEIEKAKREHEDEPPIPLEEFAKKFGIEL